MKTAKRLVTGSVLSVLLLAWGCKGQSAPSQGPGAADSNAGMIIRNLLTSPAGGTARIEAARKLAEFSPEQLKPHLESLKAAYKSERNPRVKKLIKEALARAGAGDKSVKQP